MSIYGVYRITCTTSGGIYIGSAARSIQARCRAHLNTLRLGTHVNRHLQRAWNKYGESAFVFDIIEAVGDPSCVVEREQYWMDYYRAAGMSLYNMAPVAGSMLGFKMPQEAVQRSRQGRDLKQFYGFVAPGGKMYMDIADLSAFARQHRLDPGLMYQLARGDIRHHRGWIALTETAQDVTVYGFVSPDGTMYKNIVQLRDFCRQHGLDSSMMAKVFSGKRPHYKGWKALPWLEAMDFWT